MESGPLNRPVVTPLESPQIAPARATMREVAALAGVSLKTVSRVVNGTPTVDPVLADRVHRAAAQLNYRHNMTASNLRRGDGKSFVIGLMLEDAGNPHSAGIYRAVEDVARERGVGLLAGSLDEDADRERELAAALVARRVDGLIVVPAGRDHSYLRGEQEVGTPFVFVDRPPVLLPADSVLADNRNGALAGVRHLIAHGHRRIAFLGDLSTITTCRERLAGYRDALTEAGQSIDPEIVRCNLRTEDAAQRAVTEMLSGSEPPSALFTGQNLITIGAIRALRAVGAQHRTAIVGFDDVPLADLVDPPVTVIAQDVKAMGRLAAETLFRRIDGDTSPPQTHVIPTRLIHRGSGEIPVQSPSSVC